MKTLLNKVTDLENLNLSFFQCMKGKRKAIGAQKIFKDWDKSLFLLQKQVLLEDKYQWGDYRQFYISDPKKRLISSAPFIDRIVHRAIHNIIYPIINPQLIPTTFACREGKGNGRAVIFLRLLLLHYPNSYVLKMDAKKFFKSINQYILLKKLQKILPDQTLNNLIKGLLKSHPDLQKGVGLPLGNLTSQIFANFFFDQIDQRMYKLTNGKYMRYMDDILIFANSLCELNKLKKEFLLIAKRDQLKFPLQKRSVFAPKIAIPFLGFLVSKDCATPLNRNRRRIDMKLRKKNNGTIEDYKVFQSIISYQSWKNYPNIKLEF